MPACNDTRSCPVCGLAVPPSRGSREKKFCSDSCREKSKRKERKRKYQTDPLFREKILAMNSKYFKTENGKRAMISASNSWKIRNPEKRRAHNAVTAALRSGVLVKPAGCDVCGIPEVDAHHDDYSKPLDVKWLCRRCHHEAHGRLVNLATPK